MDPNPFQTMKAVSPLQLKALIGPWTKHSVSACTSRNVILHGCHDCVIPEGDILRYLFDLTTSAHWGGPAVGITRVERELARRARQHLGDDLTFCVYDKYRNVVLGLDHETAANIIEGRTQIKIEPSGPLKTAVTGGLGTFRRQLRRLLLMNTAIYHAVQSVRGRSFTRDDIRKIQEAERAKRLVPHTPSPVMLPIALDADTILISGGLDWEFKYLRALWALKQERKFRYWAIVYDLIPILYPHYLVPGYVDLLTEYFAELYWLSDGVMCISEATRRDWIHYCEDLAAQQVPSYVFPLGSDLPTVLENKAIPELPAALMGKRYALFVSTIEPRKNHRLLYNAWDDCVRQGLVDVKRDRLVFVGRRGWAMDDFLQEVQLNPATRDSIVILNDVEDTQLNLIYRSSAFVLFPSHYEGFGLPVAEALGHGKPCISSDAGALPEIGSDLVLRLNAKDTPAWTRAIAQFMGSPDELKTWEDRVAKNYRPTTWDMAAKTFFATIAEKAR